MKSIKYLCLLPLLSLLVSCDNSIDDHNTSKEEYGIYLGAKDDSIEKLLKYDNVAIEIGEFSIANIERLKANNTKIYAYISVGSLENYRPYYNEFKDYTFMDYENWPDERWIDVSQVSWQNHLVTTATGFKELGADGLFMDNFDVYYIASEEYECSNAFKEGIYNGCHKILDKFSKLDLSLMINSGTDFLERMKDENDNLLKAVDVYAQECVFSNILDYDKDKFGKQDKETKDYYLEIVSFMKKSATILFIEYTKDESLIKEIKNYCNSKGYKYYISSSVKLI